MARTFSTAALQNSNKLYEIAALINGRFTEAYAELDRMVPNVNHVIPASPTAGYVLGATDANTLAWMLISGVLAAGANSTAYTENSLVYYLDELYIVTNNFTSTATGGGGIAVDIAAGTNLKRLSAFSTAERKAAFLSDFRYAASYTDSAPNRTYTLADGGRYFIDALAGGISNDVFTVPSLAGATTVFEFSIMPRGRDLTTNSLTITRHASDSSANFYTLVAPTTAIASDITINTNGEYFFHGYRDGSQTKWLVTKRYGVS